MPELTFPKGFIRGSATSAPQIEGAAAGDGALWFREAALANAV